MEYYTPIKSESDDRHYRGIILPNKLQVLLVSDPTTDKAAAGMDVLVGHFQDPEEFPGLAHFCEHMLFLGTAKHPDENAYSSFLSSHGGSSNAYTSTETTNYFFDVAHPYLEEALDMFAQFFIAPLFTESATERELNAVESENAKNLQSDEWRLYQLLKSTANPAHPFHKFGTGNLATLFERPKANNLDIRKALLEFHSKYYSSNVMKLVVLGREPLDVLEQWVVSRFTQVKDTGRAYDLTNREVIPFRQQELGQLFKIVPVKDLRNLGIIFPFPATDEHYLKKPTHYLSHLIGHESQGSLLSLLKKRGLANELSAGSSRSAADFELFKISIKLTDQAAGRYEEVVQLLFEYIQMLKDAKMQEWIFREIQQVDATDFRFKEKDEPFTYVSRLGEQMQLYPPHHAIAGPYLLEQYDPELISSLLNLLNPSNMRIHLVSKDFAGVANEKEEWYGTEFSREPLAPELLSKWTKVQPCPDLHLPPMNEFVPTDFDLKPREAEAPTVPVKLIGNDMMELWFKQDDRFNVPKMECRLAVVSPVAYDSPAHSVMSYLFVELLEDALNEYSYLAQIAGLKFALASTTRGLTLRVNGYNQKLPLLAEKIVDKMRTLEIRQDRFDIFKEKLGREYRNYIMNQPWDHSRHELEMLLLAQNWDFPEKIRALEQVTRDDMQAFCGLVMREAYLEFLIAGNVRKEEAVQLAEGLAKATGALPLSASRIPERRVVRLEDGKSYVLEKAEYNPENVNSAIYQYYQIGLEELHRATYLEMLSQIAREPAFDTLRTKQQLGYIVWSGVRNVYGVMGFRVIIQSSVKDPAYMDDRIEEFLVQLRTLIETMPEEDWTNNLNAVISKMEEKDKTLGQETRRFWNEITTHAYIFDRAELTMNILKEDVTRAKLLAFFDEKLRVGGRMRSKLSVHIYGKAFPVPVGPHESTASDPSVVRLGKDVDYARFRKSHCLYPENT